MISFTTGFLQPVNILSHPGQDTRLNAVLIILPSTIILAVLCHFKRHMAKQESISRLCREMFCPIVSKSCFYDYLCCIMNIKLAFFSLSQRISKVPLLKISILNELILLNLLVMVLIIATIALPFDGLRVALGLPFLLFLPGYTLVATLFPRRQGIDVLERIALSFGMSIAIVSLIGLILNFSNWGIRLEPVLYSVASFIFITSIIAWLRSQCPPSYVTPHPFAVGHRFVQL